MDSESPECPCDLPRAKRSVRPVVPLLALLTRFAPSPCRSVDRRDDEPCRVGRADAAADRPSHPPPPVHVGAGRSARTSAGVRDRGPRRVRSGVLESGTHRVRRKFSRGVRRRTLAVGLGLSGARSSPLSGRCLGLGRVKVRHLAPGCRGLGARAATRGRSTPAACAMAGTCSSRLVEPPKAA